MSGRRVGVVAALVATIVLLAWWRHGARTVHDVARPAATSTSGHRTTSARQTVSGRLVAGTVTLDGAPLAGATVYVVGLSSHLQAQSDAAGRFEVHDVRGREVVVAAEKAGFTGARELVQLDDPSGAAEHLALVMHACTASIYGTVHDADGGPIARAAIATGTEALHAGGTEAAEDGSYRLCVPVGDSTVQVWADGYARVQDMILATGPVHRDFALLPEATIAGRVVRATDRAPVPGAHVTATNDIEAATFEAVTDDDGRFRIAGAGPARYTLSATAEHAATAVEVPVIADVGSANETELVLVPTASVSGTVHESGKPVAGASVQLVLRHMFPTVEDMTVLTQSDGSFRIENVLPGDFTLNVDHYTVKKPAMVEVQHADVAGLAVEVEHQTSIAGVVMYAGKPVDGASVTAGGVSGTADASGHFTLYGVTPGTYRVYAESKRVGAFTRGPEVTVAAGEQKTGVEVDMDLIGSIAGTVVDQDGAPVRGATVKFSLLHGEDWGTATTADDGSFTATALSGGGSYIYEVHATERGVTALRAADGKRFPPVVLRDGHSQVTGLRIKVRRTVLAISGTVRMTSGEPVADVEVKALVDYSTMIRTTTDASGAFTIHDVPPGTYTITASNARSQKALTGIPAGRTDVAIELPAPASIEGTLDGFPELPDVNAMSAEVDRVLAAEVTSTHFVVRDVPPGTYHVTASAPDGEASATVEVAAGGHAHVALRRQGFGSVVGTFAAPDGTPIPRAHCRAATFWSDALTDASGSFRIDKIASGRQFVLCYGAAGKSASADVEVAAGHEARVALVTRQPSPPRPRGHAGLALEAQLEDVVVTSVDADGPAAHAGIQPGDVIVKVNDYASAAMGDVTLDVLEMQGPGAVVHLVVEHGDAARNVDLTLGP